jgi:hypothetical protein
VLRKSFAWLEGSQSSPAHHSDRYSMKIKVLECCEVLASDRWHGNFD